MSWACNQALAMRPTPSVPYLQCAVAPGTGSEGAGEAFDMYLHQAITVLLYHVNLVQRISPLLPSGCEIRTAVVRR